MRRDLRYGIRQLGRSPGFAIMALLTLALGVGANTAIFSLIEGVLLRPLPYQYPDRLVVVWQTDAVHRDSGAYFNTFREFEGWQENSHSFEKLAALTWATGPRTMLWQAKPIDALTIPASVDFFSMLGAHAGMGRTFSQHDLGSGCTLVLAYHFWQQKLGAPRDILGRSLNLDKSSCTIVGIMPKTFSFYPVATDAWSLITPTGELAQKPWNGMVGAFGLLKPGVTRAVAESELIAIQSQILQEAPSDLRLMRTLSPDVLDLKSNLTWLAGRNLRTGLWMLLGASTVILLLASVNVGSLVLSRSLSRAREMAIRAAIGASRRRLAGQTFLESLVLGFAGTIAGIGVAAGLLAWFRAANPIELPPAATITIDWRVLLFTVLCGITSSIVFGLFPAWRASHTNVNAVLKNASQNQTHTAGARQATQLMVVVQVALSMILLAGAGLLSESLFKLAATDPGYRSDQLFTARIHLPEGHYADVAARSRAVETLQANLVVLPGVNSVGFASDFVPRGLNQISVAGEPENSASDVATQDVSAAAIQTLQIPLLRGRMFDARDQQDSQPVAVINQALAKEYFGTTDPLGHAIKLSRPDDASKPWLNVVGIVADVKTTTVFQEMGYAEPPAVYRPLSQSAPESLALMIAVNGSPLSLLSEIQQRLSSIDANLILSAIDDLRTEQAAQLSQPRFRSVLLGGFAALAFALTLVGLYGVLSQTVARRSRDIGIRMALGANRDHILRSVLGHACAMTLAGIGIGSAFAAAGIRWIHGMLYGIAGQGAGELAVAATTLLLVSAGAASIPAYRAASIDPVRVLRDQ